jgi:hypothetical protein
MREQQAAAAAELARREAALEAKQGQLVGLQAQLVAAQGAALQQLEVLEGAMRTRLEGHQKQVWTRSKQEGLTQQESPSSDVNLLCKNVSLQATRWLA